MHAARFAALTILLAAIATGAYAATTYTYDDLGRVKTVTYDNGKQITYSYDPAGNRTQVVTQATANQAPIAVDDSITTPLNTPNTFDPRTNDSDPESDPLSITAKTNGAHGTVAINGTTSLTYTPTSGYTGPDSFTYTISDGQSHTAVANVSVTVTAVNQAPTAVNDSISTPRNIAKTFDPRTNDSDPDGDALTITAKTNGAHGTVVINGGTSLTFTPATNYTGSDSFTYTISDGHGHTANATVNATVTAADHPPVAQDDTLDISNTHPPGQSYRPTGTIDPRTNDSDLDNDTLTITAKTNGTNGTVAITGGGTGLSYTYNSVIFGDFSGTDSFTYTISDGFGGTATATVTVNIEIIVTQ